MGLSLAPARRRLNWGLAIVCLSRTSCWASLARAFQHASVKAWLPRLFTEGPQNQALMSLMTHNGDKIVPEVYRHRVCNHLQPSGTSAARPAHKLWVPVGASTVDSAVDDLRRGGTVIHRAVSFWTCS